MDLHPTGSNQKLIEVRTKCVDVVIKGKKTSPLYTDNGSSPLDSVIYFTGRDVLEIGLKDGEDAKELKDNIAGNSMGYHIAPLFFEQCNYEIIIKGRGDSKAGFWHDNYNIRNKVEAISEDDNILTGIINFDNHIGQSDLVIMIDGKPYLTIKIEVFPSKISYKEDYKNIMSDIADEINSVVFDFMRKTYQSHALGDVNEYTPAAFFVIIKTIFADFIKAADYIIQNPHHILAAQQEVEPAHKIKKTNTRTVRWLQQHPEHIIKGDKGILVSKAMTVRKQIICNTFENQFVKFALTTVIKKLEDFRRRYVMLKKEQDEFIVSQVDEMIRAVKLRAGQSFLDSVDHLQQMHNMSLVFNMAPGYRELYKCYLMILKGLSVNGDIFNLSVKDTAQLYEYWCFIKLNCLLKKKYKLISPDVIRVDNHGITVSLVKGRKSEVRYINPRTNERIILTYNPGEHRTQTVNQRPDNVLSLEKSGSDIEYKYVFDAKYKIDYAGKDSGYPDTKPGPKVEDINTMHRYRDAIVYESTVSSRRAFEKTMFGAYVLFPYGNETEYEQHHFYKSIETVNIGGLPFLPGSTKLVEKLLFELIEDSEASAFERSSLPRGIERKLSKVDWSACDMLIGSLHGEDQLEINLQQNFYYAPRKYIPDNALPIQFIALYQSKKMKNPGIRYYGQVTKTQLCKRGDIPVKMHRNNKDELYYRFDLKQWEERGEPIAVREEGVYFPRLTNLFLFQNCSDSYELFHIHSEDQYRLMVELKRICAGAAVDGDEKRLGFTVNDNCAVFVSHGDIVVCDSDGGILRQFPVAEFIKAPRYTFNCIKSALIL